MILGVGKITVLLTACLVSLSSCRNYPESKLQENLDAEIMQVLLHEALDSYDEHIVIELRSDTSDDMELNVDRVEAWVKQWKIDNAPS